MMRILVISLTVFLSAGLSIAETDANFIRANSETVRKIEDLHRKADGLITENDFRGAEKLYTEILLLEPDDEIAYTNLGYLYLLLGEYANAKNAFENALAINPENEMAFVGLNKIMDPDGMGLKKWPDEPPPPAAPPTTPPASPQRIQTALKNAGLYNGAVDGILGSASKKAIRTFQESRGIRPDGVVGPKTWALLEPYLDLNSKKE